MARALKISKRGPAQGITINSNGTVNQPAAAVNVDAGYPNFGSLTDPYYGSAGTLSASDYLGVMGGFQEGQVSATSPVIRCQVNILRNDGTSSGTSSGNGRILRQKGAHKFLVARAVNIQDEDIVAGNTYMIANASNTNWTQFGAGPNAAVGDIFTAKINGSAAVVDNGYVWDVGQCVLSNTASPTAGYMSIAFSVGDSVAVYASYISNKWIRDWNGMTYGNYSNSNTGTNNYNNEHFYPVNFFTDEGTMTWSGAELINSANGQNGSLQLAQVQKFTS
jgi:hypothetical protein